MTLDASSFLFSAIGDSGKHESPWNSTSLFYSPSWLWFSTSFISSHRMQPMDHMSEAWSYCFSMMEISGALYHLDPTWEERDLFLVLRLALFCSIF